jgi:diguanylate cyclase (GGDEF)-like protein
MALHQHAIGKKSMSQRLYQATGGKSESPTIAQVYRHVPSMQEDACCIDVLEVFFRKPEIYALPITDDDNAPIALVERKAFVEFFGKPYTKEVHGKKPILRFIKHGALNELQQPIIVDATTGLDDVAAIIIDKGMQHMVSGVIVTVNGRYAGVANGHDLLDAITQRKQTELYYLAHYDQLTGLPNRMLFIDRLTHACLETSRKKTRVGAMFIDLDRFKQINDSLGHRVGDTLLRAVAQRLQSCARDIDTVARLGGDEFAYLMDGMNDPEDAAIVAQRIIEAMQKSFSIMGHELFVTASVGIATCPDDGTEVATLLAKADAAMYDAKKHGRNGYRRYFPGLTMYSSSHMATEMDLRSALENDELVLFYQPQVSLTNGQVIGIEALIRWQHPARGLLSPAQFIEIAEQSGLIIPIGKQMLHKACRQLRAWLDTGLPPLRMAVNVSALQFHQDEFVDIVQQAIEENQVDPRLIELELTESIVMHNVDTVLTTLKKLKEIGVMLAIDDFGTGFSSLSYLRRFPIDQLKIDQSFVRAIEKIPVNQSIVRAIIALGKSLSLKVVAEGTETSDELDILRACQCDEAQGYYFLRPSPADDFVAWLSSHQQMTQSIGDAQTCMF